MAHALEGGIGAGEGTLWRLGRRATEGFDERKLSHLFFKRCIYLFIFICVPTYVYMHCMGVNLKCVVVLNKVQAGLK